MRYSGTSVSLISIHHHPEHALWREALKLVQEYRSFLQENICFQKPDDQLSVLIHTYSKARGGVLIIAMVQEAPAGMIALQALPQKGYAEMKRLYVRPEYQGLGLGRKLITALEKEALSMGYDHLYLDTLPRLQAALHLYQSLDYRPVAPYYFNPLEGVIYLGKKIG